MRCGRAGIAGYGLAGAIAALGAMLLAGCAGQLPAMAPEPMVQTAAPPPQQPNMTPAELQEHQRILASYGGVYSDPRLQAMVEQLVERLVAASDRPDLHYKVTMLNSETVNAFALPNGQLYVTRGLIALANDESELASVIGHEMGHVIAHHAEQREEQIRDADLSTRVFTDVVSNPEAGALALAKSKLKLATFSQKQELEADAIGIAIASRAGYDPFGAVRFLASLERNSELKPKQSSAINPRAPDFLASHPATPQRITNALAHARQFKPPADDSAEQRAQARDAYLDAINGMVFGED